MAPINVLTGLTRRRARNKLPRKKRNSLAYSCTQKMLARDAMEAFETYMAATKVTLAAYVGLEADTTLTDDSFTDMKHFLLASSACYFDCAKEMLKLDSALMDVPVEVEESADFLKKRKYVSLDSYCNDDECEDKTRFTNSEIQTIIDHLDFGSNCWTC